MAYIEPCCVDNQLPALLRRSSGSAVIFQTNGDVTLEKFMRAVCCMVDGGRDFWLLIPAVNDAAARLLRHWIKMDWIDRLHLLTAEDQAGLLAGIIGDDVMALRVDYAVCPGLKAEAFAYCGPDSTVAVQGALPLAAVRPAVMLMHAAVFGRTGSLCSDDGPVGNLLANVRPLFRRQSKTGSARKKAAAPAAEPQEPAPAAETEESAPAAETEESARPAEGVADPQP